MIDRYNRPEMSRVWSQQNKTDKWLMVEIAACEAWAELGAVPKEALPKICGARYDLKRMAEIEAKTQHDVTAFLGSVAESLGEESRFVHLGLTSYDIVDTGLSLQVKEAAEILDKDIAAYLEVLEQQAITHKHTLVVGRTHGVHAEPMTFGWKMALWVDEMRLNRQRLALASEQMAVGKLSGAVGTYATVPPFVEEYVCRKLGLKPAAVSTQVIQRDRHAFFIATLAVIASSLDKMATEIRGMQRTEVLEAEEPFSAGQTGSSAMPHKRNPIRTERVCGLARVIRGNALTAMENVALWQERDISNSSAERIIFPQSCGLLDYILRLMTDVMRNLQVYPENMKRNLELTRGLIFSQRVLLTLIDKGLSRQQAYEMVQRNAMRVWRGESDFRTLLSEDPDVTAHLSPEELDKLFDYSYYLKYVDEPFKRLGLE
ncbi:MAG: adenylosuccinate lyase [Actinobacteria bacterium]|nr:adenylosuccinate lyase [Actinomycetota bacterium]